MEPTEGIGTGIPHKDVSCVLHLAKELQHVPLRGGSFFLHCLPEHADLEARTRSTHLCAEATKKKERRKDSDQVQNSKNGSNVLILQAQKIIPVFK